MSRPHYPCVHCGGKGYKEGMTELEALEYAMAGRANYTTDRLLTKLGQAGLWDLEQTGEEERAIPGYWAQGGFWVDRHPIWRSVLTDKGKARLKELESSS